MGLAKLFLNIIYYQLYSEYLVIRFKLSYKRLLAIITEEDNEVNYFALAHLDELVKKGYGKEVIVATTNKFVQTNAKKLSKYCNRVFLMTNRQKNMILKCYQFSGAGLLLVSLSQPFGNMNRNLIGVSNITKEDLVCYCCYGLFQYKNIMSYEEFINESINTRKMET